VLRATTKPLRGLLYNQPHFSRGGDPDLATVSDNEVRVAHRRTDRDPYAPLTETEVPSLGFLGWAAPVGPVDVRLALLRYLAGSDHERNPRTVGRDHFDDLERDGAAAFARRCASCHAPRLRADTPTSALPFQLWEQAVFAETAPLLWASDRFVGTGVEPYLRPGGPRVTSLRRVADRTPLFTDGAATDLAQVLREVRIEGSTFWHRAGNGAPLPDGEQASLLAFVSLL
jgi:hypothetical protein